MIILKTVALPFMLLLPWAIMKLNGWEGIFLQKIEDQPFVIIALLLPGGMLLIIWLINLLTKRRLPQ